MNDNNGSTKAGIGFVGLLTIVFIALKLVGVISWSWIWVLSPIWIDVCIALLFTLAILAITWWLK